MLVEEFGLIKIFVKENNWTGNQKGRNFRDIWAEILARFFTKI